MKSVSLAALTAALFLSAAPLAFAQSTTVDAGAGVSVDADADASFAGDGASASTGANVDADADVDLSLDANGDGTVDDVETDARGEVNADASLDTDGDGVISDAEAAAGSANSATESCKSFDLSSVSMNAQAAEVAAANNAQVVRLADCENTAGSSLASDVLAAVTSSDAVGRALQQETISAGEILGLSVEGQTVLIYVRDDQDEDDDGSDDSVEAEAPAAQ